MPTPGKRLYHIILNTHGSWLPGDPRGFRTRHHKKHSSGDYKHPPPEGEHAALHAYAKRVSGDAVLIKPTIRSIVGQAILGKIGKQKHRVLAISVGSNHVHILVELPDNRSRVGAICGTWKQAASHTIRKDLPGKVWAEGGDPILVRDQAHQRRVYEYILRHRNENAWIWSFKDEE